MRDIFRAIISSFIKSFKDTFDRANSSSLGTSSSGIPWTLYRNTFQILNNKARADSSDYSLAAVQTGSSNVEIGLKGISQGAGTSLWVTDAQNWWSVSIAQDPVDCDCTTFYNTFTFNSAFNFSNTVFVPGNFNFTCTSFQTSFCQNSFNFNSYNPVVAFFCCFGWNAADI
jgi:hypothetical protein